MDTDDIVAFIALLLIVLGIGHSCTHHGGDGPRDPDPCDVRSTC
jgi:hypothetical protein